MKLGSETGSLVNHVLSGAKRVEPELGMGATLLSWSDRDAATVVDIVRDGNGKLKRFATTQDEAHVTSGSGHDGSAVYGYVTRADGARSWWMPNRKGDGYDQIRHSSATGRWQKVHSGRIVLGRRETYRDPSF